MMNEQEMQFADPDWQPTGQLLAQQNDAVASPPQPVSVMGTGQQVPGGYQSASQSSYSEGYRGSWQEPQPSMPPSPAQPFAQQVPYHPVGATRGRGASRWWIWLIIAIVLIMMMSGGMFHSAQRGNGYAHPSFPYQ